MDIERLYAEIAPRLTNYLVANGVAYASACDIVQETFLRIWKMRETLIEASAMAAMAGKTMVDRASLDAALKARRNRADLVEELFMEEYDRDVIKLRTSGAEVGRVNGLAVTTSGDYEFGLPHQISCTVGVGHGGIIDLEREAELLHGLAA